MSNPLSSMTPQANAATKGLTVNAAFLKDIKDDNRDLKILVDRLRLLTGERPTAAYHWPELTQLWADLRDQLAMHFGLEEAYGYFEHAVDPCSNLSTLAESLRSQHGDLFEIARHLAEASADVRLPAQRETMEAKTPEVTPEQAFILDRWQHFWHAFQRHEEAELKVILDSLDNDLGGGD